MATDRPVQARRHVVGLYPRRAGQARRAVPPHPTELVLVNDNDFGVEGVSTEFWRISFDSPIA